MKLLYLDCGMGAAGDMLTAALLELLPDRQGFVDKFNALGIPGVQKGFVGSKARELSGSAMQNLFQKGDRVLHTKFGEGSVVAVTGKGSDARIQIEFTAYGVKEFSLSIAPIVKLEEEA